MRIGIGIEIAILLTRIDQFCSQRIGIESNSIVEFWNRIRFDLAKNRKRVPPTATLTLVDDALWYQV